MYQIEELIKTFAEHALKAEQDRLDMIKYHKINFPDSPIPEHLYDEFNIAEAFQHICIEIDKLWIAIGEK